MQQPVVIIGIGELGGVFAKTFLKKGHPVYPITREMDIAGMAELKIPQILEIAEGSAKTKINRENESIRKIRH